MKPVGGALVWATVGHQVCWFWSLLGGALVQAKVSHCFCLAWGYKVICVWSLLVLGLEALL